LIRKLLDRVGKRAGHRKGEVYTRVFRHTYASTRLQTLDHGAPGNLYTVSREMGHASQGMLERVYAHLGTIRHRSEVVEYRLEQHQERLGERLKKLGFVTRIDSTRRGRGLETKPRQYGSTGGRRHSRVGSARFERATSCSGGRRSIQLSYEPETGV
jgi:hypothetical protein